MDISGFNKKIAQLRKNADISLKALGEMVGASARTVSKWENGTAMPSVENLIKLSQVFGVSTDEMLGIGEQKPQRLHTDGMPSIRELYKIGSGPSSSHTIGPERASKIFGEKNADADEFKVILYGSLAKTGKGHCTDVVIIKTFAPKKCRIEFDVIKSDLPHPNTMELFAYKNGEQIDYARVFSVGGGAIRFEGEAAQEHAPELVYPHTTFGEIADYCKKNGKRLWQYVFDHEGEGFKAYMAEIWRAMKRAIMEGLEDEGILPGGLNVHKKAKYLYNLQHLDETAETRSNRLISAYAFAVGEQNACGGTIVTSPTCGAAGVVPAVMYFQQLKGGFSDDEIIRALATGGLIGNLIKTNATISGAEGGCQAEIGSACAMAAAAMAELYGLTVSKIEYSAEIAIEHHLGLTCDPICGLVQIPCIERNAVAAMRAINAVNLSAFLSDTRKISLDKVIVAMRETGHDIDRQYRETSEGGLAKIQV
ncbi:MAG: L-serine ammonia-lyase, iron-sulfur-dependent, subunit alpha [Clostridia bacterium]|nr:L-serine ammonia-lyase, iron-sulfur-dependent, subunit alpha [Clostridia bacterium]